MRIIALTVFMLFYGLSQSALATCWDGYTADAVKTATPVYASAGEGRQAFQVASLNTGHSVCVENVSGNFARIQYYTSNQPNVPKFGFIQASQLRSSPEAASGCDSCDQERASSSPQSLAREISGRAQQNSGLDEPLPYAERIQDSVRYGLDVGTGMCGRAVARILRGADLLPGPVGAANTPGGFNGEDAYEYLRNHGFEHDETACNRPGVVLVYGDPRPGHGRSRGQRGYLSGDTYGHVEVLGTDGNYHHFTNSSAPIDVILGNNRRPRLYCLVSNPGMRGERL